MRPEDPILILDVKLSKDNPQKIVIYEQDDPEQVVEEFCLQHSLDSEKRERLLKVVHQQIQEYRLEQQQDLELH